MKRITNEFHDLRRKYRLNKQMDYVGLLDGFHRLIYEELTEDDALNLTHVIFEHIEDGLGYIKGEDLLQRFYEEDDDNREIVRTYLRNRVIRHFEKLSWNLPEGAR